MLITGATLVTRWGAPAPLRPQAVRVREGVVVAVGPEGSPGLTPTPGEAVVALDGGLLAPGFVCGHTHLYSALARGMPPLPGPPPADFLQILKRVWWPLDKALDAESTVASARIGAIDALRAGTVGLIDHHAAPNAIEGSLDRIAAELRALGCRGLLCYETSDRDGPAARDAGVAENTRFAARGSDGWTAGLIGAHASFTLSDESLDRLAQAVADTGRGLHIHLAEGGADRAETAARHGAGLLERFASRGLLAPGALFAHGVDLDDAELDRLAASGAHLAHNPSSNQGNRVGYGRAWQRCERVVLGTDGIGADMFAEAKSAFFRGADATGALSPGRVLAMLDAGAALLYGQLGIDGGVVRPGAVADLIWLDYDPPTPLDADNLAAHVIFGMSAALVRRVWVGGRAVVVDGQLTGVDEPRERALAREQAARLWRRR